MNMGRITQDPGRFLFDGYTVFFGAATILYELILFSGAPSWLMFPAIAAAAVLALVAGFTGFRLRPAGAESAIAGFPLLSLIFIAASTFYLFVAWVNLDDFLFFHRAWHQLDHLREPISRTTDFLDVGAPPLSNAHLLSSFELIYALLAYGSGIGPLWFADNLVPAWQVTLLCLAFLALYQQLGLTRRQRVAGLLAVIVFCLADIRPDRSYGMVLFLAECGRYMLWSLWVVSALYYSLRVNERPSAYNYVLLFLCHAGAVGYSGSGTYMSPALAAAVALSAFLVDRPGSSGERWRLRLPRAVALVTPCAVPLALGSAIALRIWPLPQNVDVWKAGWPSDWLENLGLLIHGPFDVARLLLSVLLPWFVLRIEYAKFLTVYAAALVFLLFNPWSGPVLINIVLPANYWRFAFLFPHLALIGLMGPLVLRAVEVRAPGWRGHGLLRVGVAGALCLMFSQLLLEPQAVATAYGMALIKNPGSARFPSEDERFAHRIRPYVAGRIVLSGEAFATTLGQVSPTTRFLWNRTGQHFLLSVLPPASITARASLAAAAESCNTADIPALANAAKTYDMAAYVLGPSPSCAALAPALAARLGLSWSLTETDGAFALLARRS
jgi:hypothetical protein